MGAEQSLKMMQLLRKNVLKKSSRASLFVCVAALLVCGCSSKQDNQTMAQSLGVNVKQPSAPQVAPSDLPQALGNATTLDQLPQIQAPHGKYLLGPGDVLTVTVWGHPELSGKRVVGPDGEIQLPFVGSFRVADLNADDASRKLTSALQEDYLNTAVSNTVDSYNSNQSVVLGHVAHPGVQTFPGNPTLLEALATAGTVPSKDDQGGMPVRCAIVRGRDRIIWVDLRPLLKGKDVSLNMQLARNDVVYVPDPDDELVYVMGQVKNPGPYTLTANMSFFEALARAGGPNDNAQQGKILLARPSKNTEEVVDLESNIQKTGTNYQLEAGDIVYVPKSGLAKFGYVLQQMNPLTQMAVLGALL